LSIADVFFGHASSAEQVHFPGHATIAGRAEIDMAKDCRSSSVMYRANNDTKSVVVG
jgi:hypothetical protein